MTKPRNPRYFPRMKVRGARRRRIAGIQSVTGFFDRLGANTIAASVAIGGFIEALARFEEQEQRARAIGGGAS